MLLDVYQHNVNSKQFAINVPEYYFRVFLKQYVLRPYADTVLKVACVWTALSASIEFNICLACGKCHTNHQAVLEEMAKVFKHVTPVRWFSTLEQVIIDKMSLHHVIGIKIVNVSNNFHFSIASKNTFSDGQIILPGPLFHVQEGTKLDTESETDLQKRIKTNLEFREGPSYTATCDMPYCEWLARRSKIQGLLSIKVVPEWKAEGFYGHFMLQPDPFLETARDDNVERGGMIGLSVRSLNMMLKFLEDWRATHDWHHVLVKARAWHVFRREMLAMRAANEDVHVIYYSCLCDGTKNLKEDIDLVIHRHMIIVSSKKVASTTRGKIKLN